MEPIEKVVNRTVSRWDSNLEDTSSVTLHRIVVLLVVFTTFISTALAAIAQDVRAPVAYGSVPSDLVTPPMTNEAPAPGKRVRRVAPEYKGTEVYHTLYLPTNWEKGKQYPVIVEYTGNKWGHGPGTIDVAT
ncbi:hypothetical protein [Rubritalea profundi]|uniref:Uncharacterized protein n=1 Tax=Rubritalea profundi TaxID=1658618 RepID=A0A2S7U1B4_9BACT|nr:hypothetical protein [Rubritalea profundi]PQJ28122.1 hypothetical protein BSZ32_06145 [Rubritalea profundi]